VERALRHYSQGDSDRARAVCEQVLKRRPNDAGAHYLLGVLELDAGRDDQAVRLLGRAVELQPTKAVYFCALGLAHAKAGAPEQATEALRKALELQPGMTEAAIHLGMVLLDRGEVDEALRYLDDVAAGASETPEVAEALTNVFSQLARAQVQRQQYTEAVATARRALALAPGVAAHHRQLAVALLGLGDLEGGLDALERVLELAPGLASEHSSLIFYSAFSPRRDAHRQLEETRRWNSRHAVPLIARLRPHPHDRSPVRRLRVGYVSPDFRDHVQRLYMLPVLSQHDRAQFEIVAYASVEAPDEWTRKLRAHTDLWRDVTSLTDGQLAEVIRDDRVDVLVDLSMHMAQNRLRTFAERPAPVQLSWLAYPGTTGVDGIDYRLTDPFLDPPGGPLPPTSEQTLRLPETFWCYDPDSTEPVRELPALATGHVTFGCLNNFIKINPGVLELWARVLTAVPSARLLMAAPTEWARNRAAQTLEKAGVARERVEVVGIQSRADYLATYHRIDVCLDCVPYNGHTTSLDAFWMGVPVVTLVGSTIVGRAGLSQAMNLGLAELVAKDAEQFMAIAAGLAGDVPRLAGLRGQLRARLQRSPLMDAPRFTRALEAAYREAWRRHSAAHAPGVTAAAGG
jgi:predicted O-linked N-acetylglucosamine transferase (SPINDLY family)